LFLTPFHQTQNHSIFKISTQETMTCVSALLWS
jgi:hypothetical protein